MRTALTFLLVVVAVVGCGSDNGYSDSGDRSSGRFEKASSTKLRLKAVGSFSEPLYITAPPGDKSRIFVVEKGGKVKLIRGGKRQGASFLDLSDKISTGSEQGLLSLAFAPDYSDSGKFYVNFTDLQGDTRIQEFKRSSNPDVADSGSARELFHINQPFENHNGGLVKFGPDGLLYIGMGDGGSGGDPKNNAQSFSSLLGKLLRIDPKPDGDRPYTVPKGNPFVDKPGAQSEIYAYGLRNPWRFSFDTNGAIWIGDVGQDEYEEIDVRSKKRLAGSNFGWSGFEGFAVYDADRKTSGAVKPVTVLKHSSGNCSVTGGYVARDRNLGRFYTSYIYGDFCKGDLLSFKLRKGKPTARKKLNLNVPNLSSFGEDASGRLYVTSLNGQVYRLTSR